MIRSRGYSLSLSCALHLCSISWTETRLMQGPCWRYRDTYGEFPNSFLTKGRKMPRLFECALVKYERRWRESEDRPLEATVLKRLGALYERNVLIIARRESRFALPYGARSGREGWNNRLHLAWRFPWSIGIQRGSASPPAINCPLYRNVGGPRSAVSTPHPSFLLPDVLVEIAMGTTLLNLFHSFSRREPEIPPRWRGPYLILELQKYVVDFDEGILLLLSCFQPKTCSGALGIVSRLIPDAGSGPSLAGINMYGRSRHGFNGMVERPVVHRVYIYILCSSDRAHVTLG